MSRRKCRFAAASHTSEGSGLFACHPDGVLFRRIASPEEGSRSVAACLSSERMRDLVLRAIRTKAGPSSLRSSGRQGQVVILSECEGSGHRSLETPPRSSPSGDVSLLLRSGCSEDESSSLAQSGRQGQVVILSECEGSAQLVLMRHLQDPPLRDAPSASLWMLRGAIAPLTRDDKARLSS